MTLPYVRKPTYLSPTALMALERDPVAFYRNRCGPEAGGVREPKILGMVVGSCFDAYVKLDLAKQLNLKCPSLAELLQDTMAETEPAMMGEGSAIADELTRQYKASGAFDALVKEGVALVNLEPGKQAAPGTSRPLMGKEVGGVPILGYPDALIRPTQPPPDQVVLDWKTNCTASPRKGWKRKFDAQDGMARFSPPHSDSVLPFCELHHEWATQLATYDWLLRPNLEGRFHPIDVAIDQIVYTLEDVSYPRPHKEVRHVRVFQFRGKVSGSFQEHLRSRYEWAWKRLTEETLVPEEEARSLAAVPEQFRGLV